MGNDPKSNKSCETVHESWEMIRKTKRIRQKEKHKRERERERENHGNRFLNYGR